MQGGAGLDLFAICLVDNDSFITSCVILIGIGLSFNMPREESAWNHNGIGI